MTIILIAFPIAQPRLCQLIANEWEIKLKAIFLYAIDSIVGEMYELLIKLVYSFLSVDSRSRHGSRDLDSSANH